MDDIPTTTTIMFKQNIEDILEETPITQREKVLMEFLTDAWKSRRVTEAKNKQLKDLRFADEIREELRKERENSKKDREDLKNLIEKQHIIIAGYKKKGCYQKNNSFWNSISSCIIL